MAAHELTRRLVVVVAFPFVLSAAVVPANAGEEALGAGFSAPDRQMLSATLALLPGQPGQIALVDADAARPEVRQKLLTLDAFVLKGRDGIFLVRQSALVKGACAGSRLHRLMLASVIWHEMAHLGGADETGAQRAEEQLWTRFIRDGKVEQMTALRYLNALTQRR
jgi:hypothetical protein